MNPDEDWCTTPRKCGWEGSMYAPRSPRGRAMTTVCKCNPGAHWTRPPWSSTDCWSHPWLNSAQPLRVEHPLTALQSTFIVVGFTANNPRPLRVVEYHRQLLCSWQPTWLLCHLVDSSARMPTKDVPSCDKPEGAARRRRTQDLLMGIPTAIASRNGERPELKHLSTARKRNRMGRR